MDETTLLAEFEKKEKSYSQFGTMMNSLITRLMRLSNIETHSIYFRVKDKKSLKNKITLKNKYESLNQITDILGVRIITYYSEDVSHVESVLKEHFIVDEKNTIDKRKTYDPDRFGYMSLHYVVSLKNDRCTLQEYSEFSDMKFEIQIRTILQHTWAEIEHDLGYKSTSSIPNHIKRKFAILSGTLELIDEAFIEIKKSLVKYDTETKSELSKEKPNILDDNDGINNIFMKNFIEESVIFNKAYDDYIRLESNSGIDTINESNYIYPFAWGKNKNIEVNFEAIIDYLKFLKIETPNEFISLINEISKNEKLKTLLFEYSQSTLDKKVYSKYFYLLFSLYFYTCMENKVDHIKGENYQSRLTHVHNFIKHRNLNQ